MTEQQLRALYHKDKQQGSAALFDTYYNYVCAVVFRRVLTVGTREDAEECVTQLCDVRRPKVQCLSCP